MNHIDITFDMETCATTANAAVMQVAAVAWNRSAKENPFEIFDRNDPDGAMCGFNEHIDLRTCVVDGFDFDQATVKWWANQTDKAKKAVTDGLAEPVEEVFIRLPSSETSATNTTLNCHSAISSLEIVAHLSLKPP